MALYTGSGCDEAISKQPRVHSHILTSFVIIKRPFQCINGEYSDDLKLENVNFTERFQLLCSCADQAATW